VAETLLLIDDDADLLRAVGDYFERVGYDVAREGTGEAGLETYERLRPDVVLLDLHLPGAGGLEILERMRAQGASVILLTGQGDIETAVRAMQLGAENFLTKPVDLHHLAAATARVAEKARLTRQNALLRAHDHLEQGLESLGVSPAMRDLAQQIELLARGDRTTVLLTGERGTGKASVARIVHRLSPRAAGAFVELNCGGRTTPSLDAELFGHETGAVADAVRRKQGLFEIADGGSVLLDDIGELTLELQPKLVTFLDQKTLRRLGGTRERSVDVRLIAATARDLVSDVKAGRFRGDLFSRLGMMTIHLPAVRERSREDRLDLVTRILAGLQAELPGCASACTSEALDRLLSAPWPGNVREMRNVLERAVILSQGSPAIGVEHLPADLRKGTAGGDRRHAPLTLAEVERQQIERALRFHGGNRTRAAQELGISRATLINKIKQYQLQI
jgi:DNA-binding NtrC family response regulator